MDTEILGSVLLVSSLRCFLPRSASLQSVYPLPNTITGVVDLMELSYRGVTYSAKPAQINADPLSVEGKYRGHDYGYHYAKSGDLPHTEFDLQYRGITIYTAPQSQESAPAASDHQDARVITSPLQLSFRDQLAQVHHHNLLDRLQRRIESAKARGDQDLIQILEAEERQMA